MLLWDAVVGGGQREAGYVNSVIFHEDSRSAFKGPHGAASQPSEGIFALQSRFPISALIKPDLDPDQIPEAFVVYLN